MTEQTIITLSEKIQQAIAEEKRKEEAVAKADLKAKREGFFAKFFISLLIVVAIIIYRAYKVEFQWQEILLFALAAIPWFSSFTESFKFGKDGLEIKYKDLKEKLDKLQTEVKTEIKPLVQEAKDIATATEDRVSDIKEIANTAKVVALRGVGKKPAPEKRDISPETSKSSKTNFDSDDWQKGRWGGKTEDEENGRRITARVEKISGEEYYRRIIVRVESTDAVKKPLTGKVKFHLHPTFDEPVLEIKVVRGIAETELVAFGAFTIGAEADGGNTKLEFDLKAELDDGKDQFFKR